MVRVVPRVLDGNVPEETAVFPQDVIRPGPPAQLGPLHGPGLFAESTPVRDEAIPGRMEAVAGEATGKTIEDG